MTKHHSLVSTLGLTLSVAIAVALSGCGQQSGGAPGAAGPGAAGSPGMGGGNTALTVATTHALNTNATQILDTAGGLYAWQEVAIGSEVSGYRVAEVLADVGDSVAKGQVLARLDNTLLRQAFDQASASVAVAKATLAQAQSAAQRGNTLQQSGLISKQDAEQLNTNVATASAQLQSAEAARDSAKQRLEYAEIKATDAGVLSARSITPGQIANSGSSLFTLIRDGRVEWRAEIPAAYIGKVRRGMAATIKRADGSLASGTVRTVSPGIDATSQRGTAYIDLKLEAQIRPGMYVTGSIELAKSSMLSVPLAALTVRDGFSYVFVVQADKSVRQQRVTVNRLLSDSVELLDGISAQDEVVATGAGLLRDGDRIQVATAPVTKSAASASSNQATS